VKARLLDLFSGAGGAARGYQRAGFHVTGVDIRPQPRYAGDEFIQADALTYPLAGFDAIHASPPCQRYTSLRSVFDSTKYDDLLAPTRVRLQASGVPYVIENVVGAPMRGDIILCAAQFGLRSYRHRLFESNVAMLQEPHQKHEVPVNPRKKNRRGHWDAGGFVTVVGDIGSYVGPEAMGIDWMTGHELSQAIPPFYTEWIGERLMAALKAAA
jgi:DNA (cytosine-5)-methyltransferase 1